MPYPVKPPHLKTGHSKGKAERKTLGLVVSKQAQPQRVMVKPPAGLLPASRRIWRSYWESPVSQAAEVDADQHVLHRWIEAIDEWQRCNDVFKKARLVKGSMGQPTLNPLAAYLRNLESTITYCEQQMGLTPMARVRLGIAIGEAKLTADELNRRLSDAQPVEVEVAEGWESEWQAV